MFTLPIITLISIYYYYYTKNDKHFGPISFLILVYVIMGVVAIILEFSGLFPSVFPYKFIPMAYLSLSFLIIFNGFSSFRDRNFTHIKIENILVYKWLENIVMYGGFASIVFFLPFAISGISGDVELNRLGISTFQETVLAQYGLINSVLSLFSNFFILAILFAFINFSSDYKEKNNLKGYLLLISSFSYVIYVLAYVGRDGVVYWGLTYLFIYFLFKKFLSPSIRKNLIYGYVLVVGILIIPFMIISVARFSAMAEGVGWRLLEYAGCQLKNFNDSFYVDPPLLYGRLAFPVVLDFLGNIGFSIEKVMVQDRFPYYLTLGVDPWIFKTFIGDLLMDFGKIGTLIYLLVVCLFTKKSLKKVSTEGTFSLSSLILFILLYQTILWGVFYFRLYSANFYIIAMILIAIAFRLSFKHTQTKTINVLSD